MRAQMIKNEKRAKQLVLFDGVESGRIHPTDMDWYLEYHDEKFIFGELKLAKGSDFPKGQKTALSRTADAIYESGRDAICVVSVHGVENPDEPIILAETIVSQYYIPSVGSWLTESRRVTVKDLVERFLGEGHLNDIARSM